MTAAVTVWPEQFLAMGRDVLAVHGGSETLCALAQGTIVKFGGQAA